MENTILDFEPQKDGNEIIPVSQGTRLGNYIIDLILFNIVSVGVALLFSDEDTGKTDNPIFSILLNLILYGCFMMVQELLFQGRSVGKFLTGTKVVDESGFTPPTSVLIARNLCRAIPFNALSFLGARGWHDSISGTYVVAV
jgi:uncharacterized RDD family membrane protein YckC